MQGSLSDVFGISADELALGDIRDPQTPASPGMSSTEMRRGPSLNPVRALIDPRASAIFWIGLAAVLGLAMVSGQLKVSAAIAAKGGKR